MKTKATPAFQFYPDDFLGSGKVGAMTPAEVGIYVFLLCLEWNEGGFAFHPGRLARFCRTTERQFISAWQIVGECFVEREGRWYNPRLERERQKQAEYRERQVNAGKASAQRRLNQASTAVEPAFNSVVVSVSPSPSPTPVTTTTTTADDAAKPPRRAAKGKGVSRPTWITPFEERWKALCGPASWDIGPALKEFAILRQHYPDDEILRRLDWYVENRGSEVVLAPERLQAIRFTPMPRDFRQRFTRFDPSEPSTPVAA